MKVYSNERGMECDCLILVNWNSVVIFANQVACDLLGKPFHEISGEKIWDCAIPEGTAIAEHPITVALREGVESTSTTMNVQSASGKTVAVTLTAAPFYNVGLHSPAGAALSFRRKAEATGSPDLYLSAAA